MNWSHIGHNSVHWLDVTRHWASGSFSPYAVGGNIGAGFYWAGLAGITSYIVVPKVREWVNGHVAGIHKKMDDQHEARLRHAEQLHTKSMDLAKRHHNEHMAILTKKPAAAKTAPVKKPAPKPSVAPTPQRRKP